MKHTTGTPQEQSTFTPHPKGKYRMRVVNAEEKVSSKGNDMIEITLRALDKNGEEYGCRVFDYLTANWKLDSFLDAANMFPGEGQELEINADELIGKELTAQLAIEKDNKGNDRNKVAAYIREQAEEGF